MQYIKKAWISHVETERVYKSSQNAVKY